MIIYKDAAGVYVATQAEAKRTGKGWEQVEVPTTDGRSALCDWLNSLIHGQPDELGDGEEYGIEALPSEPVNMASVAASLAPKPNGIEHSIAIDDAWNDLPLSRKLHFAADAMEQARMQLNGGNS